MKKILTIVAVAAALVASPARATNGMRMIGFGPIQDAMGGASAAAPLDGATVVTNPAGLSALSPRIDLAGQGFSPSVKYTANWSMGGPPAASGQSSDRPTDWLPTLAGVYRPADAVTVGLAALGTAGMGVDYGQGSSGLFGGATMSSYLNGRVAPAVAYRVSDQLSVGVAANLMYAQMSFNVMMPSSGQTKFDTASSIGYGATIGVTYQPVEVLTLGAAYETRSWFQDFEFTVGGQKMKLAFDQPMVATVGAAVRPLQGLLFAVDGQWINWSDIMGRDLPKFTSPPGAGGFNMRWSDQLVVKVGAEYQLPALKELRLRAGYNYGKAPVDRNSAYETVLFPAITEHHFTVGAGYDFGRLAVNAAFVYSPEATVTGSNPSQGVVSYTTKMSQTAFELGGSYRF
jgi:long-chain fatty acid transport protein